MVTGSWRERCHMESSVLRPTYQGCTWELPTTNRGCRPSRECNKPEGDLFKLLRNYSIHNYCFHFYYWNRFNEIENAVFIRRMWNFWILYWGTKFSYSALLSFFSSSSSWQMNFIEPLKRWNIDYTYCTFLYL